MKLTLEINTSNVLRWALGLMLVWAALSKLANPQEFYGSLLAYRLPAPDFVLAGVAVVLPWLELLCGMLLVGNFRVDAALLWCVLLFATFTFATGQAWARGLQISCGCFDLRPLGIDDHGPSAQLLHSPGLAFFRALLFGIVSVFLLRVKFSGRESADQTAATSLVVSG